MSVNIELIDSKEIDFPKFMINRNTRDIVLFTEYGKCLTFHNNQTIGIIWLNNANMSLFDDFVGDMMISVGGAT